MIDLGNYLLLVTCTCRDGDRDEYHLVPVLRLALIVVHIGNQITDVVEYV